MSRHRGLPFKVALLVSVATGCNTARYGPRYNERLPQVQQIAIVPMSVSLNSGWLRK